MNPYFLLGSVIAFLLSGVGGYFYGHSQGVDSERVIWQGKEIKATQEVISERDKALADKETAEHAHQAAMLAASRTYQEGLRNERAKKDRAIADNRAGTLRLRDPGAKYALGPNPVPGDGPAARRCDAAGGADLSSEAAEFLIGEASRADEVARQLTACQNQLAETYRVFGPR